MQDLFTTDSYLWIAIIGLFAGWVARLLKPGNDQMGLLWTMLLGVGGSVLATVVGRETGLYSGNRAAGFIGAVVGAMVLLVIVGWLRRVRVRR